MCGNDPIAAACILIMQPYCLYGYGLSVRYWRYAAEMQSIRPS